VDGLVVTQILQFNAGRRPDTLALKLDKLRQNPYSFFRGTCHLFFQDWSPPAWLEASPLAAICGDLHLENFGVYQGDNRLAYFDVNDFDEAALAPVAWDLVRFVTSLYVGLRVIRRQGLAAGLAQHFLAMYAATLSAGGSQPVDAAAADGPIGSMLRAYPRQPAVAYHDTLARLTVRGRRLRVGRGRLLPAAEGEKQHVAALVEGLSHQRSGAGACRVLDVARYVAGTSSLGLNRYAVLVDGAGTAVTGRLLDVKEMRAPSLSRRLLPPQPHWPDQAARAAAVQRQWQAVPPDLLWAAGDAGQSFLIRKLARLRERMDLTGTGWTEQRLALAVGGMAAAVANGHLRTGQDASALAAFAREAAGRNGLIRWAHVCAERNNAWFREYSAAYDRGKLALVR
jgi:uncharacterized protein (DUF2252 family)